MNSQKRLLLTLKYLWEKTDEEHPATLKEIGEYLQHNGSVGISPSTGMKVRTGGRAEMMESAMYEKELL